MLPQKFIRLYKSFSYALQGFKTAFSTQPNFKIHSIGFIFMNVSSYYMQFDRMEYIVCLILSCLVFSLELVNTAIESSVDLVSPDISPLAKTAKDCAAGAVLVAAICAVIAWSIISYWHLKQI